MIIRHLFILFFFIFTFISFSLPAQSISPDTISYRYWIYFKDKGKFKPDNIIKEGSEAYHTAVAELSKKAIWRRSKVLPEDEIIRYSDIPVNEDYIKQIKNLSIKVLAKSKWFNAVSINVTGRELEKIKKMNFVSKIEGVHFLEFVKVNSDGSFPFENSFKNKSRTQLKLKYDYGPSYWQNEMIKVPILHNCGITGYGVTVGMCDDGFNWRNHQSLKNRRVLGEYDWIFKDDTTHNQSPPNQFPQDDWNQDDHGTSTMSTLGGFYEGQLLGPAFDVEFYLSKSEFNPTETPVEEDYWLEAVEWMEANGVDIISSSLIYKPYDLPNNSYDYKDMNGSTTVISRAADYAVHLGVVVCNSMGNERQTNPPSIVSPPDGDSVIGVGSVDSTEEISYFSSNGPTSDGRIKPDVVAMGSFVWAATSKTVSLDDSTYFHASGTSYSCPLTAGVCALILSVHPELTPIQVRDALRNTANKSNSPDNTYGWGLINAFEAALYYGMVMSNKPEITFGKHNMTISTYVLSKNQINAGSVKLFYSDDGSENFKEILLTLEEKMDETNSGKYSVTIQRDVNFDIMKLYFASEDEKFKITSPYNAPERFFYLKDESSEIEIY
ncbi:MAG: S8 family serine peptidase [Ignavibacteria bacterium]